MCGYKHSHTGTDQAGEGGCHLSLGGGVQMGFGFLNDERVAGADETAEKEDEGS